MGIARKVGLTVLAAAASVALVPGVAAADPAEHQIRYTLTQDATVTCVVKNAAGRVIRTLPPIDAAAGVNTLSWNGRTDEGSAVPPGQYMIEIRAATQDGQRASGVRSLLK